MCHLERVAAGVCREAGARVTTTTLLALNLPFVERLDERRIEVITNGVPLFHGAQFAIDNTGLATHGSHSATHSVRVAWGSHSATLPEWLGGSHSATLP